MNWLDVSKVFRALEQGANMLAPLGASNPIAAIVIQGSGAALGLVADIIDRGQHPIDTITRIRSSLDDFAKATDMLEREAKGEIA